MGLKLKNFVSKLCESKLSFGSNYSEINFISEVEIEQGLHRLCMRTAINTSSGNEEEIFADELLELTTKCEKEVKANEEQKKKTLQTCPLF